MLNAVSDERALPTLFCLGRLKEVGTPKVSEKGYCSVQIDIAPIGTGKAVRSWVILPPKSLGAKYKPATGFEKRMYAQNVSRHLSKDKYNGYDPSFNLSNQYVGLAKLHGLTGSPEEWNDFGVNLQSKFIDQGEEFTDDFLEAYSELLSTLVGRNIGYILKQQVEDSDELNEKGYKIKVPGRYYELAGLFFPTDEVFEKIEEAIETFNNAGQDRKAVKMFDQSIPFDSFEATEE